jgi:integrase
MRTQKGYIYKRYGYWYLRYSDTVTENGIEVRKQLSERLAPVNEDYRDKKSVKSLAAKVLAPINAGEVDPRSTMRIDEFVTTVYLPEVQEQRRRSTYKNYNDIFRIHVRPRLAGNILRKFRCCDAEKLLADVARQARTPDGLPLSHSTLERVKAFLSGVFKCAKRKGAFDGENPVRDSSVPKGSPSRETHAYSAVEIQRILSVLDEPARTVVLLMAHTGLRKGECMGLLWRDYDGYSLKVERALWNGFVHDTKTVASKAPIRVTPQLRMALEAHRERMGDWGRDGFPIFQSEVHSPMDIANLVKRVIAPALERCEVCRKAEDEHKPEGHLFTRDNSLPQWHGWHAFRRGLATNLHAAGVDDKTIQAILRHSNVRITQDVYIKTVEESTVNAMNLIGEKMELAPSMQRSMQRQDRKSLKLEARGGIEPPIKVLQTFALPLGDRAPSRWGPFTGS